MSFENNGEDAQQILDAQRAETPANAPQTEVSWAARQGVDLEIDLTKTGPQIAQIISGLRAK